MELKNKNFIKLDIIELFFKLDTLFLWIVYKVIMFKVELGGSLDLAKLSRNPSCFRIRNILTTNTAGNP